MLLVLGSGVERVTDAIVIRELSINLKPENPPFRPKNGGLLI
jgi:hypothetical protein